MAENPTTLAVGQIWHPASKQRTKAREIVRLGEWLGVPHVFWTEFYPNCGHTEVSPIRVEGFRAWIRKHKATIGNQTDAE